MREKDSMDAYNKPWITFFENNQNILCSMRMLSPEHFNIFIVLLLKISLLDNP